MYQYITPDFIKSCLLTQSDYKNTKNIKQAILDNQEFTFETICNTIKEVLNQDVNKNNYPPISKLYAMRLSKELIDILNMRFVNKFEAITLQSLKYYAEFNGPSNDQNRGTNLFGENMEKEIRQIGMSLVRLALECINAWARFFPQTPENNPTKYFQLYYEIKSKGYQFPNWTYYKEEFIKNNEKLNEFDYVDLLMTGQIHSQGQQMKQQQYPAGISQQTPITPANPRVNIVQKSKSVIQRCKDLIDEVGDICCKHLICKPEFFEKQLDEAMAKNQEMDIMVNELIECDQEDLAAEVMLEMDNLQALEKDINSLNYQTNQEFRKKYIKGREDTAQLEESKLEEQKKKDQDLLDKLKRQAIEEEEKQQKIIADQKRQQEIEEYNKQKELERLKKIKDDQDRQEQERKKREEEEEKKRLLMLKQEEERREEELKKKYEEEQRQKKIKEEEEKRLKKMQEDEENLKRLKQLEEEEEEKKKIIELQNQQIIQEKDQKQQGQIILNNNNNQRALEQIGSSQNQNFLVQPQKDGQSFIRTSQFSYPVDKSTVVKTTNKPISHSSQGLNPQPQFKKITGDLSGAPDLIKEEKQQQNQFEMKQLELLQQQIQNLQRDNGQLKRQLEEEENRNKKLKEDAYQLNGGGNRIQEDLRSLQIQFDKLQQEKIQIQNQHQQTLQKFNEYKVFSEGQKQQQKDQNDFEINKYQIESQQLFSEKQALLKQIDQMKAQQVNHGEIYDKQYQNELLIAQQKREIENLKQEKEIIQNKLQKEIDLKKNQLNDQQSFSDTLNNQLNIYKQQLEKSQKDYLILQENQKKSNDELLQQVFEARRENLTTKQQLNSNQLQLSDKEAEYKQLQQSYQASQKENQQLKKNLESAQQQIDQFIQKNMDNRSSTLLQQKLQQKLDEIDKLKEDHKNAMKEKDEYYKQRIDDLTQDRNKLQKDVYELQNQLAAMEANQKKAQEQQNKNHSKSQVSELESIQQKQQIEIFEIKVNANKTLQEANAGFDNKPIIQIQCPISVFKHFPKNKKFYPEQITQKSKNINPECLDLIFPYNSPEDYFNNKPQKSRKGKVIQQNQNFDDISHLNKENLIFFKQRCLGSQGILYEDYGLQFGLIYQTQVSQSKAYFTYGLYIINNQGVKQDFQVQFLEIEKFQQFWVSPQEFKKNLDEDSNELIEILIGTNKIPQQILALQISDQEIHPFQIYIPNHICQQIIYREIKVNEFKNKWKQFLSNQIRTPLLNLNKGVMKDIQNFQKQLPKLIILNNNKISDFELGIDEIKLGGLGQFSDIQFLIKFEILPNDKICIYLSFESKFSTKKQILEQILNGYGFILGDGKSL